MMAACPPDLRTTQLAGVQLCPPGHLQRSSRRQRAACLFSVFVTIDPITLHDSIIVLSPRPCLLIACAWLARWYVSMCLQNTHTRRRQLLQHFASSAIHCKPLTIQVIIGRPIAPMLPKGIQMQNLSEAFGAYCHHPQLIQGANYTPTSFHPSTVFDLVAQVRRLAPALADLRRPRAWLLLLLACCCLAAGLLLSCCCLAAGLPRTLVEHTILYARFTYVLFIPVLPCSCCVHSGAAAAAAAALCVCACEVERGL
jgi:hypothetical protein